MTKLVFVDIDGTLIDAKLMCALRRPIKDATKFDVGSMRFLREELCADPEARIVICSFWRTYTDLETFKLIFKNWQIDPDKIIGMTPVLAVDTQRGLEVREWLLLHPEIIPTSILILDDQSYDYETVWPVNWVRCNLINQVETQNKAREIFNTPVHFAKHPAVTDFIALEQGLSTLSSLELLKAVNGNFFEVCRGLNLSEEALLSRIIELTTKNPSLLEVSLGLHCIITLYPRLNQLKAIQPPRKLTLHLDDNIDLEWVLHALATCHHEMTLYASGSKPGQIEGLCDWLTHHRWAGKLTVKLTGTVNEQKCLEIADILQKINYPHVQIYRKSNDSAWQLIDIQMSLNIKNDQPFCLALPSPQTLLATRAIKGLFNTFYLYLSKMQELKLPKDIADLNTFNQFHIDMLTEFFKENNIGGFYQAKLKTLPGVAGGIEVDPTTLKIVKFQFCYTTFSEKIKLYYDIDVGIQLMAFAVRLEVLKEMTSNEKEICLNLDLQPNADRHTQAVHFFKSLPENQRRCWKSKDCIRFTFFETITYNSNGGMIEMDELIPGVAHLEFDSLRLVGE